MVINKVQGDLISLLNNHFDFKFIKSSQQGKKPNYPYCIYNFISPLIPEKRGSIYRISKGEDADTQINKRVTNDNAVASFTLCDSDYVRLSDKLNELVNYFLYTGAEDINALGLVVVELMDLDGDRSIDIDGVYFEQRVGFDVRLRLINTMEKEVPVIDGVET